jgi:hypothetical protein
MLGGISEALNSTVGGTSLSLGVGVSVLRIISRPSRLGLQKEWEFTIAKFVGSIRRSDLC